MKKYIQDLGLYYFIFTNLHSITHNLHNIIRPTVVQMADTVVIRIPFARFGSWTPDRSKLKYFWQPLTVFYIVCIKLF